MNTVTNTEQVDILGRCVSIDLEVNPSKAHIFAFATVTKDPETPNLIVNSKIKTAYKNSMRSAKALIMSSATIYCAMIYLIWLPPRRGLFPWQMRLLIRFGSTRWHFHAIPTTT